MKVSNNILNPNSKFRRKINQFDLGGDFTIGKKRLYSLIDTFHEEYILNKDRVPKLQWEYLKDDIRYIDSKIISLKVLISREEHTEIIDNIIVYWENIRGQI